MESTEVTFPGDVEDLNGALCRLAGYASACWSDVRSAGEFQSGDAAKAVDQVEAWIKERYVLREQG